MDVVAAGWGVCIGAAGAVSGSTEAGLGGPGGPCTGVFRLKRCLLILYIPRSESRSKLLANCS